MTTLETAADVLTDDMLARFDERAPEYDRDNRFFHEDFEELRDVGLPDASRCPRSSAAPGCGSHEVVTAAAPARVRTRRRPRSR